MAPFVGEERREVADLLSELYGQVLEDSTPRMICIVAEGGWGKTRIVQEFYGWLQQDRQPQGAYWPPKLSDPEQDPMRSRKVIYPERVVVPMDQEMPWLWWGLRCEQVSSGRKLRALINDGVQLKAHLAALIKVAERREDNRDLALSILGETMAFLPGVGQIASIAMTAKSLAPRAWKKVIEAFKAGQGRRRAEQEPRTVDLAATSAPEVNVLVELVKQFVSPELPLVLAIDDAHAADPDTVEFVRRVLTLKAPVLVVCTAWPSTLEDQLDEERGIEPVQRQTFGGLLDALQKERPDTVLRQDLSPLPDDALAELVTAVAPTTAKESMQALIETSGGNPLVLRLNLTSPRIQRSIVDGAITLSPQDLRKLPRGFGRIISERFEDLADADQLWLAEAALQGFEFLPGYLASPIEDLDLERISAFVRLPGEGKMALGRFIEPAVHRAILEEAEDLMSSSERAEWARTTLAALVQEPMQAPDEEEGGRTWCRLLLRIAEEGVDPQPPDNRLVSRAAYQLSFIERDLGLHGGELAAAEAAVRWAATEADGSVRALRAARWAAALQANNEPEEAVCKAQEALALIEAAESPSGDDLVTVMYVLAKAHLQDQDPSEARDVGLRARDSAEDDADRITALELVAEAQWELGDSEGGRAALAEALEIARKMDPPSQETVLDLETELLQMVPHFEATELWSAHLRKVEAELGTDHFLYLACLTQVVYHHLLAGDLEKARPELVKLKALPGYESDTGIEAMIKVLSGGDLGHLREALHNLIQAPYSSRSETALFSQLGSIVGASPSDGERLEGPFDFVRRVSVDLDSALKWLLTQFQEHADEWDEEDRLFAVQSAAVHLGEYLLRTGSPSPVSQGLLEEIDPIEESHSFPLLLTMLLRCYIDALAVLEGKEVEPVDKTLPPLLQVRALTQRAVAASTRGDRTLATEILEDAYVRMEELGTWPSRKLVLAAAERCSSPLCAKGWETVADLEFGSDGERWEAHAGLAAWLYRRRRYREAAPIERRVLEERTEASGPRDPGTMTAKANLAITLLETGSLEEARDLYYEVVKDREDLFGEEHPLITEARRQLVQALVRLGDFEGALPIQKTIQGTKEGGIPTINDRERMATILENVGEAEAARPLREEILERWVEDAGEDDERTLQTLVESVGNLRRCKAPEEAYPLARRLVEARLRNDGPDGSASHVAKLLLASVCLEADKPEEAIRLQGEVVDSRTRTLGPAHPLTLEARSSLGATLYGHGDFQAACAAEGEVLEARKRNVLEARARAAMAASALSQTLAEMDGKLGDAREMLQTAVGELRRLIGDGHPETARSVDLLVEMHLKAEQPDMARKLATEVLQNLREKLGADHPATAAAADRLASIGLPEQPDGSG